MDNGKEFESLPEERRRTLLWLAGTVFAILMVIGGQAIHDQGQAKRSNLDNNNAQDSCTEEMANIAKKMGVNASHTAWHQQWLEDCERHLKAAIATADETIAKAEQGDAHAQSRLSEMYFRGWGVKQNYAEGVKWLRKAAEQGIGGAQEQLGGLYDSGSYGVKIDYAEAEKWYRKRAEQGSMFAQASLGSLLYAHGTTPQSHVEAAKWFHKSAEQGWPWVQVKLGELYYKGDGVQQDYAEAAKWFRKGAEQDHFLGQYNLGEMYYKGVGVPQDYISAWMWVKLSASRFGRSDNASLLCVPYTGTQTVSDLLNAIEHEMTPAQLAEAQKRASTWKAKKN